MPAWAWVLCILLALLGLAALFLALFRVRYRLEWRGQWDGGASGNSRGAVRLEYGFPGFMREWDPGRKWSLADLLVDDDNDEDADEEKKVEAEIPGGRKFGAPPQASPEFSERAEPAREEPLFLKSGSPPRPRPAASEPGPGAPRREPPKSDKDHKTSLNRNRRRRALFRFATDRDVWRFLARYGVHTLKLLFGLLRPRFEAAVGDPDPARLGRLAGRWYAVRPLLPVGDSNLYFRFQDRHPSLWVKAEGGFSALSALTFGIRLLWAFPLLRLGYRALYGWRHHRLTGWRAWTYRRLQTRA